MAENVDWERVANMLSGDSGFSCPYCKSYVDATDGEVNQQVVSYWGEDLHNFSCDQCGEDFVVKETVTRQFNAAKTAEDFE